MDPTRTAKPADPRIGMVLSDRYRIDRKLGDGGMGAVYEGEHLMIGRRVAIKVLHAQFAQNAEIVARFQREAQAATSIGHPNIVSVIDMGRFDDGTSYMVLELLDGRDWSHDIKAQGAQPLGKCVHILDQVCDALEAAHAKGIVHRDLKPENVFLVPFKGDPNFAKVLDFGISKVVDEAVGDRSLTQTGTALGTPYYMAPEQCQGKKDVDLRADIYSLGVMLFQALTGQYPFDDESYPMLVLKICTEPPPALTRFRPDVPIEVEHIVNRMLAKHRAHRFASCAEVRDALRPFLAHNAAPVIAPDAPQIAAAGPSVLRGGAMTPAGTRILGPGGTPPAPTPYSHESPRSNVPLLATLGGLLTLLLIAGVGVGTWFALSTRADTTPDTPVAGTPPEPAPDPDPAPPPEVEPAPPAAPTDVQPELMAVQVRVLPADASGVQIRVDEALRSSQSSWDGRLAPGNHHLVVEADGYHAFDDTVAFTEGTPMEVELERERHSTGHGHAHAPVAPAEPRPLNTGRTEPVTTQRGRTGTSGATLNPFNEPPEPPQRGRVNPFGR